MAPRIVTAGPDDSLIDTEPVIRGPTYLHWSPIFAGAIVAAAVSFVLISFGSGIGLAVASPSSSWRDTSSILALLGGLWLLLTSLAAFGLGGYLAGHLREILSAAPPDAVEFRDGIHGLLVWGLAIIMGALLTLSASRMVVARGDLAAPTAATAEPLLAFELDRLFRFGPFADRARERFRAASPSGEDPHNCRWAHGNGADRSRLSGSFGRG
jgi:hypothetical protein